LEDGEVYVLSHKKVEEEKIKLLMEEFHQEFSLLYGEFKPVHVRGFCVPLKDVKNYEEFFSLSFHIPRCSAPCGSP
jgi:hypothetical protein